MAELWKEISSIWGWSMEHLLYINLLLSIIIIFFQRRDPKAVWTWLLVLYFLPIFGFLFYWVFCQDMRKSKMFRVKEVEDRLKLSAKNQEELLKSHRLKLNEEMAAEFGDMVYYNLETSGSVLTIDNKIDIFTDGNKKFEDLRKEMNQAKHFIHIQYYIIKNDEVFDSFLPILIKKAKEGVEVRILYDGMGGRFMPARVWNGLKDAGVRVGEFFPPFLGRLHLRMNYRNHRKIVIIDGDIGYVGGFNVGKEYISKDPKFGYWRDTHLKITGGAALSLQIRFALDWNYASKENLFKNVRYFTQQVECSSPVGVQIIASGPDTKLRYIRDNYIQLISKAKKHIYIQTPYFVPDDAVLSALQIAAKSGVDVRLMIPCKPDHPFVYWATYSYVGDLLAVGARCYVYENGFLHSKGLMIDGLVCSFGTANMDIRSFELNFEVNAVIYDEESTKRLEQTFLDDLSNCREITLKVYGERTLWIRFKEQCSRLLSPLL